MDEEIAKENRKFKIKVILISAFIIITFLSFIGVMVKMILENGECIDNPFKYAAEKLEESGGKYSCKCTSLDPKLLDFTFSAEKGIEIINPDKNYFNTYELDFSNIEVKGG